MLLSLLLSLALAGDRPTERVPSPGRDASSGEADPPVERLATPSRRSPDDRDGWKGLPWGAAPLTDMVCNADSVAQRCTRPDGSDLLVGDLVLNNVTYWFFQDQLYMVLLGTEEHSVAFELLAGLKAAYGPGFQDNQYIEKYFWHGQKVQVLYEEQKVTGSATVLYSYGPIQARVGAAQKAAAQQRSNDL